MKFDFTTFLLFLIDRFGLKFEMKKKMFMMMMCKYQVAKSQKIIIQKKNYYHKKNLNVSLTNINILLLYYYDNKQ